MYERMMGLNIVDQEMYQQYRNLMQPILKLQKAQPRLIESSQ